MVGVGEGSGQREGYWVVLWRVTLRFHSGSTECLGEEGLLLKSEMLCVKPDMARPRATTDKRQAHHPRKGE